jgi:hypothetical protein
VEDFSYASGAQATGITLAPNGDIYSSGSGNDTTSTSHGLVIASADSGNTWVAPLLDESVPGWDVSYSGGVLADAIGNLYVAGWTEDTNLIFPVQWLVNRSSDGGSTWTTVDDFVPPNSASTQPNAMAVDSAGNLFVAGTGADNNWVTRRGVGGTNFTTVDGMSLNSSAHGVFIHPTSGIFVVGYGSIPSGRRTTIAWIVRRSADGGNSWQTVDTFQYASGATSYAEGGGIDSQGNVYVVGYGDPKRGASHWLVRKSSNGGSTWTTVDDVAGGSAHAFGKDSNGNLFVAGIANSTWTLRKNPGGTGIWSTVDTFQYAGANASAVAIAANVTGNLFVAGSGSGHWLIKRY